MRLSSFLVMMSRPSRARGLKPRPETACHNQKMVAPLAGAWIETMSAFDVPVKMPVAPLAGAWIETSMGARACKNGFGVAPLAGAWIETDEELRAKIVATSRPSRARGLKRHAGQARRNALLVAPLAGAWIETCC